MLLRRAPQEEEEREREEEEKERRAASPQMALFWKLLRQARMHLHRAEEHMRSAAHHYEEYRKKVGAPPTPAPPPRPGREEREKRTGPPSETVEEKREREERRRPAPKPSPPPEKPKREPTAPPKKVVEKKLEKLEKRGETRGAATTKAETAAHHPSPPRTVVEKKLGKVEKAESRATTPAGGTTTTTTEKRVEAEGREERVHPPRRAVEKKLEKVEKREKHVITPTKKTTIGKRGEKREEKVHPPVYPPRRVVVKKLVELEPRRRPASRSTTATKTHASTKTTTERGGGKTTTTATTSTTKTTKTEKHGEGGGKPSKTTTTTTTKTTTKTSSTSTTKKGAGAERHEKEVHPPGSTTTTKKGGAEEGGATTTATTKRGEAAGPPPSAVKKKLEELEEEEEEQVSGGAEKGKSPIQVLMERYEALQEKLEAQKPLEALKARSEALQRKAFEEVERECAALLYTLAPLLRKDTYEALYDCYRRAVEAGDGRTLSELKAILEAAYRAALSELESAAQANVMLGDLSAYDVLEDLKKRYSEAAKKFESGEMKIESLSPSAVWSREPGVRIKWVADLLADVAALAPVLGAGEAGAEALERRAEEAEREGHWLAAAILRSLAHGARFGAGAAAGAAYTALSAATGGAYAVVLGAAALEQGLSMLEPAEREVLKELVGKMLRENPSAVYGVLAELGGMIAGGAVSSRALGGAISRALKSLAKSARKAGMSDLAEKLENIASKVAHEPRLAPGEMRPHGPGTKVSVATVDLGGGKLVEIRILESGELLVGKRGIPVNLEPNIIEKLRALFTDEAEMKRALEVTRALLEKADLKSLPPELRELVEEARKSGEDLTDFARHFARLLVKTADLMKKGKVLVYVERAAAEGRGAPVKGARGALLGKVTLVGPKGRVSLDLELVKVYNPRTGISERVALLVPDEVAEKLRGLVARKLGLPGDAATWEIKEALGRLLVEGDREALEAVAKELGTGAEELWRSIVWVTGSIYKRAPAIPAGGLGGDVLEVVVEGAPKASKVYKVVMPGASLVYEGAAGEGWVAERVVEAVLGEGAGRYVAITRIGLRLPKGRDVKGVVDKLLEALNLAREGRVEEAVSAAREALEEAGLSGERAEEAARGLVAFQLTQMMSGSKVVPVMVETEEGVELGAVAVGGGAAAAQAEARESAERALEKALSSGVVKQETVKIEKTVEVEKEFPVVVQETKSEGPKVIGSEHVLEEGEAKIGVPKKSEAVTVTVTATVELPVKQVDRKSSTEVLTSSEEGEQGAKLPVPVETRTEVMVVHKEVEKPVSVPETRIEPGEVETTKSREETPVRLDVPATTIPVVVPVTKTVLEPYTSSTTKPMTETETGTIVGEASTTAQATPVTLTVQRTVEQQVYEEPTVVTMVPALYLKRPAPPRPPAPGTGWASGAWGPWGQPPHWEPARLEGARRRAAPGRQREVLVL